MSMQLLEPVSILLPSRIFVLLEELLRFLLGKFLGLLHFPLSIDLGLGSASPRVEDYSIPCPAFRLISSAR